MIAFGPVTSRRLGKSLGINNLTEGKLCSYECAYCQIGRTPVKTILRKKCYKPVSLVREVEKHLRRLDKKHFPDYLTFVANGEPTLDINLGDELKRLKKTGIPIAVITNASLLDDAEVREALLLADWISVKVDTVDEDTWKKINRPCDGLDLHNILQGIKIFSTEFKGLFHTETMLIEDYNDQYEQLTQTAAFISALNPATAFLAIPTRPPALRSVKAVAEEKLTQAWQIYSAAGINTHLLYGFEGTDTGYTGNAREDILNITAVHPLRNDTLSELLRKDRSDRKIIDHLVKEKLLKKISYNNETFYTRNYHHIE